MSEPIKPPGPKTRIAPPGVRLGPDPAASPGAAQRSPAGAKPASAGPRPAPGVPRPQPVLRKPTTNAEGLDIPRRRRFGWKAGSRTIQLGERALLMGVINVTPDSFSDGGRYMDPDLAYARAIQLEDEGADLIDIGAESTRPGSERVSEGEELRRLIPVLKKLKGRLSIPISVDTYKSNVAMKALEYGVDIINDPSGLTFDAGLAKVTVASNAGLIINHMRGTPDTWNKLGSIKDLIGTVVSDLEASVSRARRAGVERERIVIDPGIGFGKRKEQNAEILAKLDGFASLDMPVLVGPSRKQFLRQATEDETEFATAAAVTAAVLYGAHIVRVHDMKAMRAVVEVAEAIFRAGEPE